MYNSDKLQLNARQVQNLAQDNLWPAPPETWPEDEDITVERLYREAQELSKIINSQQGIYIVSTN